MGPVELVTLTRVIREVCASDEALGLLPDNDLWDDGEWSYGWTDGGCLILAEALAPLLDGHVWALVVPALCLPDGGQPVGQHFVASVPDAGWFVDGDGAGTAAELVEQWSGFRGRVELVPFDACAVDPETPRDAYVSERLSKLIDRVWRG